MLCLRKLCSRSHGVCRHAIKHITNVQRMQSMQSINDILKHVSVEDNVIIRGWVKSVRRHKDLVFLDISDGSSVTPLQILLREEHCPSTITMGTCVEAQGTLVNTSKPKQPVEVQAHSLHVFGPCDPIKYPFKSRMQHSPEYLREWLHLRPRTNIFSSLLRIRSAANKAIHDVMQDLSFVHVHTPILTSNDCEGAGEVFRVEPEDPELIRVGQVDGEENEETHNEWFFNVPTYLTVSGQLHLEVCSGALARVYTFGPTFRAENSRTRHHLAEFYMLEAEMAFVMTTEQLMQEIERVFKGVTEQIVSSAADDVEWYLKHCSARNQKILIRNMTERPFERMTYTEAIAILEKRNDQFVFKAKWGCDLHKEHERHLVAHCGDIPVFVSDYPKDLKPFYARINDDGCTVAAVDLLAPGVGEICGGSLREERLDVLEKGLSSLANKADYEWYLDLRRFGSAPHGGFGIGFERHLQTLLGITNIKDSIPFPRYTHNCPM